MTNWFRRFLRGSRGHRRTDPPRASSQSFVEELPLGPGMIYPDLLPENVWGSNLRGILSQADWDRIRIPVCEAGGMVCRVCGQVSHDPASGRPRRPDCHELWRFELSRSMAVQRLASLVPLCVDCHRVQHLGRANALGELPLVVMQLRNVNCWSDTEIRAALENAGQRIEWRRSYEWDLDLSLLKGRIQVDGYPGLLIPAADRPKLGNSYFGE
jgi:hypothetical protein